MTTLGILLVNLGSPDAATPDAVKRYLKEFLSDRRVVDLPAIIWQPILRGIILRTRPEKVAAKYQAVWHGNINSDNAPLKRITAGQVAALEQKIPYKIYWAMRYQNPSIHSVVAQMHADGIREFVLLPMYPQYSTTTTLTVVEAVERSLRALDADGLTLTTVSDYHVHPSYIDELAKSVRTHWLRNGTPNWLAGDQLLVSFHGIPEALVNKGDPYQQQCQATYEKLVAALQLDASNATLVFQSRFGAQKWLQPYASATLKTLGGAGVQRVDVICPGFSADCLETLEEVSIELKNEFIQAGGQSYHYIPCLNEQTAHLQKILTDVSQQLVS